MWEAINFFLTTVDNLVRGAPYGPDYGRWYPVNCQTWTSSDTKTTPCIEMDV